MGEVERIGVKIESVYKIERIKTQTDVRPRYVGAIAIRIMANYTFDIMNRKILELVNNREFQNLTEGGDFFSLCASLKNELLITYK